MVGNGLSTGGSTTTKSPPQIFSPPNNQRFSPPNNQPQYEGFKNHTASGKAAKGSIGETIVKMMNNNSTGKREGSVMTKKTPSQKFKKGLG